MSPDEARQLVADFCASTTVETVDYYVLVDLEDVANGEMLTTWQLEEPCRAVECLVIEGETPADVLEALHVAAEDNLRRHKGMKDAFGREIRKRGARAVGRDAEREGLLNDPAVLYAFMDADEFHQRRNLAPVGRVLIRNPRAREPRRRHVRSSRASRAGPDDDPHEPGVIGEMPGEAGRRGVGGAFGGESA